MDAEDLRALRTVCSLGAITLSEAVKDVDRTMYHHAADIAIDLDENETLTDQEVWEYIREVAAMWEGYKHA